jgi:hypothetical protein
MQRGECGDGHCGQFSISISDGERGLTIRFDSEQEFRHFLDRGQAEGIASRADSAPTGMNEHLPENATT